MRKVTLSKLGSMKRRGEMIAALGVYDSPMAAMADEVGFELFVIGNSGPMALLGHPRSTDVEPDELLFMTRAVSRVTRGALVVATMPYLSYCTSKTEAVRTAGWLVAKGGADCVQCHGARATAGNIEAIVGAGIPVLAHLGLQSVHKTAQSGFGVKGRSADDAVGIANEARAMVAAGAFAIMLELVPAEVTAYLRTTLPVPVLSLGSGRDADGIYLVSGDLANFSLFKSPKNAGRFADLSGLVEDGLRSYFAEARSRRFPGQEGARHMSPAELEAFQRLAGEGAR